MCALLVVDVGLGDAQFLLNAQLDGQSVGVPSCLAVHLKALHRLVAVEGIFDATRQYVVYTWVSVGRRRSFKEYKLRTTFTFIDTLVEDIILLPLCLHLLVHLGQVQPIVFGKSFSHSFLISYFCFCSIISLQR